MATTHRAGLRPAPAAPSPYANPARCGVLLGLLMLVSFVVAGRGIGASGAFAVTAGRTLSAVGVMAPAANGPALVALTDRLPTDVDPWDDWLVLEILGVFIGGALSARLAGRRRRRAGDVAAGGLIPLPSRARLVRALVGGALMGVGARLAWGCTSGLALSGGALLATGAWLFTPIAFATAIAVSWAALRQPREVSHG